jgi:hypothetical protein
MHEAEQAEVWLLGALADLHPEWRRPSAKRQTTAR